MYHSNKIGLGDSIFCRTRLDFKFNNASALVRIAAKRRFFLMSRSRVGIPKKENALGSAFLEVFSLAKLYKSTTKLLKKPVVFN